MSYLNLLFSLLTVNEVSWKDIRILESHLVHLQIIRISIIFHHYLLL